LISQIQILREAEEERQEAEKNEKLESNPQLFEYCLGMSTERNGG
jgi:hypothetical protein